MKLRDYCSLFALVIFFTFVFSLPAAVPYAKTKGELNASVKAGMNRFKKETKGGAEYLKGARGALVMPGITKAGFVVGGKYGQGALLVGDKPIGYYSLAEGSVGWHIGVEKYDMVILSITGETLWNIKYDVS